MKILKFKIKNYKSIKDSGDCYLTDNLTILAGKNESGKTSILEALADFHEDKEISTEAIPIDNDELQPSIEITFKLSAKVINDILKKIDCKELQTDDIEITIIKRPPSEYKIAEKDIEKLGLSKDIKENIDKRLQNNFKQIHLFRNSHPAVSTILPELDIQNIEQTQQQFKQFYEQVIVNLNSIPNEDEKNKIQTAMSSIFEELELLQNHESFGEQFLLKLKKHYLPYFILYNSFEDEFPHQIPISELKKNEWAKDITVISNFSPDLIVSDKPRCKKEHKTRLNIELKGKFEKYWTQDPISLEIDWDNNDVHFWIVDGEHVYKPNQRSKGLQWYLSFFIKVGAKAKERAPNIILIDEPGLFLHAKAQKDVLACLEDLSEDAQIIFSTHSPYLIESDQLHRVRLISKNKKDGTFIENKIHAKANKETLTPILTAIGLALSDGIQHIDRKKNVVVEGPADVFYLQAFNRVFKHQEGLNFIFGGGAGNMGTVGTILQGWGCKVLYLYDNDKGKKDGTKNLTKNWRVSSEQIKSIIDKKGSIEDILSESDFRNYVLCDNTITYDSTNSEHVKKSSQDKVLLARLFLQKSEQEIINLDETTKKNVGKLLNTIDSYFVS